MFNNRDNFYFEELNYKIIGFYFSFLISVLIFSIVYIFSKQLNQKFVFMENSINEVKIINVSNIKNENKELVKEIIELNSSLSIPKSYLEKNLDLSNLFKINKLILDGNISNLKDFDNNDTIKLIKADKINYLSIKHIINLENLILLNVKSNEIKSYCIKLNDSVSNLIKRINKDRTIPQNKKEYLFNESYFSLDKVFNNSFNKLIVKYNYELNSDILFIQEHLNTLKY